MLNKKINSPAKRISYVLIIIAVNLIAFFFMQQYKNQRESQYLFDCVIVFLLCLAIQFILYKWMTGKIFTFYGIFILFFVIFCQGNIVFYGLGAKIDAYNIVTYGKDVLIEVLQYQSLCVGGLFVVEAFNFGKPLRYPIVNKIDSTFVFKTAYFFAIITGIVSFVFLLIKLYVFFAYGGYEGTRELRSQTSSLIGLIDYFYVPFSILAIVYAKDKKEKNFLAIMLLIWSILTALIGERSKGVAGILVAVLIMRKGKKGNFRAIVFAVIGFIAMCFFMVFIKYYRNRLSFEFDGVFNTVIEAISEMGSSFLPTALVVKAYPSMFKYIKGRTYFFAAIAGLIPESIDITGIMSLLLDEAFLSSNQITSVFHFSYGIGFSLCAEGYANFSYFGFIPVMVIGLILNKFFNKDEGNKFSLYVSFTALFQFATLPRRQAYYVVNHSLYCFILIPLLLIILERLLTRSKNNKQGDKN